MWIPKGAALIWDPALIRRNTVIHLIANLWALNHLSCSNFCSWSISWKLLLTTVIDISLLISLVLRIHWRLSTILKISKKCIKQIFFLIYKSMYILKVYSMHHWDKTQMLKKIPSDKINSTKNALFFISWAPSHHSFNLRSYMSWNCVSDFLFSIPFRFY